MSNPRPGPGEWRPRHVWTVSEPWYDPGDTSTPLEAVLPATTPPPPPAPPRVAYKQHRDAFVATGDVTELIAMEDAVTDRDNDIYDSPPA
jgi:hypothetical protein